MVHGTVSAFQKIDNGTENKKRYDTENKKRCGTVLVLAFSTSTY